MDMMRHHLRCGQKSARHHEVKPGCVITDVAAGPAGYRGGQTPGRAGDRIRKLSCPATIKMKNIGLPTGIDLCLPIIVLALEDSSRTSDWVSAISGEKG
jgi:hypothetical protein